MLSYGSLISAFLGIAFALLLIFKVLKYPSGSKRMQEVARAIQDGAKAYLDRQYRVIFYFAVTLAVLLWFAISWRVALGFLIGAFFSASAGYIGMMVSVRANVRVADISQREGLAQALRLAFSGGGVTGFFVVSLALLAVAGVYLFLGRDLMMIVGVGFGGSLISLFARVGGGIYTKAADVGADLVGKIEAGIPEDDPRNPAVIADNVGDNVGDCAGMAADLFETYAVTSAGAMLLGGLLFRDEKYILFPLLLGAVGIVASIFGSFFVRLGQKKSITGALYKGLFATGILALLGFYFVTAYYISDLKLFYAALSGILVATFLFMITDYYTSSSHKPVREIARSSQTGAATNIITGLAYGLESTFLPVLVIIGAIIFSYFMGGLYGIAIAAAAMLSLTGSIITLDAYGPITDNAGGISEMAGLSQESRKNAEALDAVGNTTKAVTKAYAIGSATLAALTLFAAYVQELVKVSPSRHFVFRLDNPLVLVGLLFGASVPFLFSSFALRAVGRAAFKVVEEVRRQFKAIPGIMKGRALPDYGKAVDIVTLSALKEMIAPALIAVLAPVVVGFVFGPLALGGLLLGVIIAGVFVALQMTTGGAAWDNAKKYIEEGNLGGKGSETHKAAVVGDTVGDPYKDTAGPAINPLIKVINTLAILFSSAVVLHSLQIFKDFVMK